MTIEKMVQSKQHETKNDSQGGGPARGNRNVILLFAGATVFAVLAVAVLAILNAAVGVTGNRTPTDGGLLPVGSEAPGFTAETVRGDGEVTVGDGSEPATMLVFFATWCPHCNKVAPTISELESQYDDLQVVMIGVDRRDDPAKVREFVDRYDIEGTAIYQPSLGSTYRVSGYPTTYVLNSEEEVVASHSGEAPKEAYESWIEEALGSGH
jgi:thiol-disulfide isomerase/thioredoxin